jgi:hypothetical protein
MSSQTSVTFFTSTVTFCTPTTSEHLFADCEVRRTPRVPATTQMSVGRSSNPIAPRPLANIFPNDLESVCFGRTNEVPAAADKKGK